MYDFKRSSIINRIKCFNTTRYILFSINNQSDGLFHAGAAHIPEDPNSIDHVVNLEVEGANHQELVNHKNMTQKFKDIFHGDTQANPFFITN